MEEEWRLVVERGPEVKVCRLRISEWSKVESGTKEVFRKDLGGCV